MKNEYISEYCRDRTTDQYNLTSKDYLIIAGCKKDYVQVFPFSDYSIHKQRAGLVIIFV